MEAHKLVKLDDVSLAVTERGEGPPVVLVHGSAPASWGSLPDLLSASRRVIAYDRRGFGNSEGEPLKRHDGHVRDLVALLGWIGTPATVIGWSVGGVLALEAALAAPERVARLVLIEPPLHAKRHPTFAMVTGIVGAQLWSRLGRPKRGARSFLRWALATRDGKGELDLLEREHDAEIDRCASAIVRELSAGTGEALTVERLATLRTSVVCLHGDRSSRSFESAALRLKSMLPVTEVQAIAGAGHLMAMTHPDPIVEAVLRS